MCGTYSIEYHCDNCGYSGAKQVKKGERRPSSVTCDNCLCSATTSVPWGPPKPRYPKYPKPYPNPHKEDWYKWRSTKHEYLSY